MPRKGAAALAQSNYFEGHGSGASRDLCSLFRQSEYMARQAFFGASTLLASSSWILRLNYSCLLSLVVVSVHCEMPKARLKGCSNAAAAASLRVDRGNRQPLATPSARSASPLFGFVHLPVSSARGKIYIWTWMSLFIYHSIKASYATFSQIKNKCTKSLFASWFFQKLLKGIWDSLKKLTIHFEAIIYDKNIILSK